MLLDHFGIEIASSFGPLKGKIWRIGTMGYSCSKRNVLLTLGALEAVLLRHGHKLEAGKGAASGDGCLCDVGTFYKDFTLTLLCCGLTFTRDLYNDLMANLSIGGHGELVKYKWTLMMTLLLLALMTAFLLQGMNRSNASGDLSDPFLDPYALSLAHRHAGPGMESAAEKDVRMQLTWPQGRAGRRVRRRCFP